MMDEDITLNPENPSNGMLERQREEISLTREVETPAQQQMRMRTAAGVKCSHCGGGHDREEGVVMLLFAERKWYRPDDDEAIEILKGHVEISNMCKVAGEVCTDVIMSSIKRRKKEIPIAEYAVIVPVSNDQTRKVWVRTGGKTALSDHEVLRIGSRLLIDGMILSRKNVKRHTICRLCGQMFEWDSIKPMIAAYAIEYLKDFKEFEVEKAGPDQDSDILEADGSVEEEADDQEEGTT